MAAEAWRDTSVSSDGEQQTEGQTAMKTVSSVERVSKFLRIASDPSMPDERGVMSNDNKLIAIIGYYKPWRQWVLYPQPNTVWSIECLAAIQSYLESLTQ